MVQASLTVWKFDDPSGAEGAGEILDKLAIERIITISDAATVSWREDERKPTVHQLTFTTGPAALGGGFWGMLFGLILFVPLFGAPLGAATEALASSLCEVGIEDGFINKIRDQITPGTSALFAVISDAVVDEVDRAFVHYEPSELVFTSLTAEHESALRTTFATD
jgi:uncharacterized membrane protein